MKNEIKKGYYFAKTIENKWGVLLRKDNHWFDDKNQDGKLLFGIKEDFIIEYRPIEIPCESDNKGLSKLEINLKKCKHSKGTFYSPETGIICQGCKQKLIQTWVSKEEKETISFLHESK